MQGETLWECIPAVMLYERMPEFKEQRKKAMDNVSLALHECDLQDQSMTLGSDPECFFEIKIFLRWNCARCLRSRDNSGPNAMILANVSLWINTIIAGTLDQDF